jgi:DNA-binding GntR family transcriptional regulator
MDSYTSAERKAHGKKLAKARTAVTEALRVAEVVARSAHHEGVPETQIAEELGVDRMTVRKWLGKR